MEVPTSGWRSFWEQSSFGSCLSVLEIQDVPGTVPDCAGLVDSKEIRPTWTESPKFDSLSDWIPATVCRKLLSRKISWLTFFLHWKQDRSKSLQIARSNCIKVNFSPKLLAGFRQRTSASTTLNLMKNSRWRWFSFGTLHLTLVRPIIGKVAHTYNFFDIRTYFASKLQVVFFINLSADSFVLLEGRSIIQRRATSFEAENLKTEDDKNGP